MSNDILWPAGHTGYPEAASAPQKTAQRFYVTLNTALRDMESLRQLSFIQDTPVYQFRIQHQKSCGFYLIGQHVGYILSLYTLKHNLLSIRYNISIAKTCQLLP